jgi:hypothetical protein
MNANEMRQNAQLIFESIASGDTCGFEDPEWAVLLTKAQYEIVFEILKEGVTRNTRNRRFLDAIVKSLTLVDGDTEDPIIAGVEYPDSYLVSFVKSGESSLSDKLWWVLSETWIGDVSSVTKRTRIDSITFDEYSVNKDNPFRKPDINEAFWSLPVDGKIIVITDGTTYDTSTMKYKVEYVQNPMEYPIVPVAGSTPTQNCVLHKSIHPRIVERAARLAKAYVNDSEGFQLQYVEDNKK